MNSSNEFQNGLGRARIRSVADRRVVIAFMIAASLSVASACSSSSTPGTSKITQAPPATTTSLSTTTKSQAASAYLAAVAPANSAANAFNAEVKTWTNSTTNAQAEADAQPVIAAFQAVQPKLLAIAASYPPAAVDLKAEVNAYAPLLGDLTSLGSVNLLNASSWVQQTDSDIAKASAAANIVRSDLGLPPR